MPSARSPGTAGSRVTGPLALTENLLFLFRLVCIRAWVSWASGMCCDSREAEHLGGSWGRLLWGSELGP